MAFKACQISKLSEKLLLNETFICSPFRLKIIRNIRWVMKPFRNIWNVIFLFRQILKIIFIFPNSYKPVECKLPSKLTEERCLIVWELSIGNSTIVGL